MVPLIPGQTLVTVSRKHLLVGPPKAAEGPMMVRALQQIAMLDFCPRWAAGQGLAGFSRAPDFVRGGRSVSTENSEGRGQASRKKAWRVRPYEAWPTPAKNRPSTGHHRRGEGRGTGPRDLNPAANAGGKAGGAINEE